MYGDPFFFQGTCKLLSMGEKLIWCFSCFSNAQISFAYGIYTLYDFIYPFLKVLLGFVHQFSTEQHKVCVIVVLS
jgi:hypothetical protein